MTDRRAPFSDAAARALRVGAARRLADCLVRRGDARG
jgi:hypothetical protein